MSGRRARARHLGRPFASSDVQWLVFQWLSMLTLTFWAVPYLVAKVVRGVEYGPGPWIVHGVPGGLRLPDCFRTFKRYEQKSASQHPGCKRIHAGSSADWRRSATNSRRQNSFPCHVVELSSAHSGIQFGSANNTFCRPRPSTLAIEIPVMTTATPPSRTMGVAATEPADVRSVSADEPPRTAYGKVRESDLR
jgi:hypothetical protein